MISSNSLKNFATINSILILFGVCQQNIIIYFKHHLFSIIAAFILRNYCLLKIIDFGTKKKPSIQTNELIMPKESYPYEFHVNVVTTTMVEAITYSYITNTISYNGVLTLPNFYDMIYFVPISFVFEICFDFFHYFAHRLLHHKYIYKYLHKKHHKFKHPTSITTFYQDPIDLIITNSLPTTLSFYILMSYISQFQFHLIIVYKNLIEISGHCGKKLYPTSSFTQFIWLPKYLHIELYTEDHDLHHSLNNCNYAKRFSLWDKIFRTYKTPTMVGYEKFAE